MISMPNILIRLEQPDQAVEFVQAISKCAYDADLKYGSRMVDAKSLLGVLSLAISRTVELILHTDEECLGLKKELTRFCV